MGRYLEACATGDPAAIAAAYDELCVEDARRAAHNGSAHAAVRVARERGATEEEAKVLAAYPYGTLYSTVEVAAALGITTRRVQVLSQHRGVGRQVGRAFVFTAADIEAMRRRVPGRPKGTTR